ncbi:MAG: YdcF family protein [Anaerolineales bacterium]|nr:YdcF family protein [Anaerolineales bacterium]
MFKKRRKMILYLLLLIIIVLIGAPRVIMVQQAVKEIYSIEDVPPARAAVVFGAGLTSSGGPTTVLKDRVETAVILYQSGKVEKVLMSGDNRFLNYNEPGAMKAYALELGMPEEHIILDFAGRRTYDTCYRAGEIFQLNEVVLVTQQFHLSRALYTCNSLGLDAVGVSADLRTYRDSGFWNIREIPASLIAFIQVHLTQPEPVLGEPEPIFPLE